MILSNDVPATDLDAFIAWVRERPGEVNYASAAIGSATHMAAKLLSGMAGLEMEMIVFQGAAPALLSVVSASTDMYMGGYSTVAAQVDAGNVRAVAVAAPARIGAAPDILTFAEHGLDIQDGSWFGLMAPAAVPADILDQINADVAQVLGDDAAREALGNFGLERMLMDREGFRQALQSRIDMDAMLIEAAGIEVN